MYLYMNNVKTGERNINLFYPIDNFDTEGNFKEIAIVNFFQDTTTWNIGQDIELKVGSEKSSIEIPKKKIPKNNYTERELKSYIALGNVDLDPVLTNPTVTKVNKIGGKNEINFYLSEIDNTQNLIDNHPSDLLLKYYITDWGGFLRYQPKNPEYKPLKNGLINSLSIKILDENNQLFKNDLGINILFHIR